MVEIEILNSFQVPISYAFNWNAAGFMFGIFLILGVWGFGPLRYRQWEILTACLVLGVFFAGLSGEAYAIPNEFETHYEVLLSDEIILTEFLEDYEIVGQEGKIYTIRERTEANG
jgi:hypothetical protein